MSSGPLAGRTVLLVEDEPLVALDIRASLEAAGASVLGAHTLSAGLRLADHADVSVAVVEFRLSDGDGTAICERLKRRGCRSCCIVATPTVPRHSGLPQCCTSPRSPAQLIHSVMQALGTRISQL